MRYFLAIASGALLSILPALLLVTPELAWLSACNTFVETSLIPQAVDAVIENPCGMTHRHPDDPMWVSALNLSVVALGCVLSGILAVRVADERRLVVSFLAPFLGYVGLLIWELHIGALFVGIFAGLLGIVGVGWQHLTNAWRTTRSKQRAPQA